MMVLDHARPWAVRFPWLETRSKAPGEFPLFFDLVYFVSISMEEFGVEVCFSTMNGLQNWKSQLLPLSNLKFITQ
jgi:hypothetical protein